MVARHVSYRPALFFVDDLRFGIRYYFWGYVPEPQYPDNVVQPQTLTVGWSESTEIPVRVSVEERRPAHTHVKTDPEEFLLAYA